MRIKLGLQSLSYLNYVSWFNCLKIYVDNSILNKEYISIDSKLVGGQKSNLHSVAKSLPIRRICYSVMNPKRKSGPQLYTIQFGSYIVFFLQNLYDSWLITIVSIHIIILQGSSKEHVQKGCISIVSKLIQLSQCK